MTEHHLRRGEAGGVRAQLERELEALRDRQQRSHAERRRTALQVAAHHPPTAPAQRCVQFTWDEKKKHCLLAELMLEPSSNMARSCQGYSALALRNVKRDATVLFYPSRKIVVRSLLVPTQMKK